MAKIPMGNFGQSMPQVERIQMPQNQTGQMIAGALQNIGQVAGQVAQQRKQEQNEKDRLQGATVASSFSLDIENMAGEYRQRVASGEDATVIDREFSTDFAKRLDESLSQIPESVRKDFAPKFTDFGNRQISSFYDIGQKTEADTARTSAKLTLDNLAKMKNSDMADQYAGETIQASKKYLSPSEALEYAKEYKQNQSINTINESILTSTQKADIQGLQKIYAELDKPDSKFNSLDGQTIHSFKSTITSRIEALNHRAQVVENERVQSAGTVFNQYKSQVLTGRALDDAYSTDVGVAVKGTEYESEYEFYKQHSGNFQKFSNLSTPEMLKRLNTQKANSKNTTSNDPVTENKIFGVYQSIYDEKLKTIKENPNQAVREVGLEVNSITGAELKANPQSVVKKIIGNATKQAALKDENLSIKPISTEDLPEAKKAFDAMPADKKLDFIAALVNQSKGIAGGNKIWGATLEQLGGGNKNYIAAGMARAKGFISSDGRDVAESILTGTDLLKNKQLMMPKEDIMRQKFTVYAGNTLQGEKANTAYETFKAIYADTMAERGFSHTTKDANPDKNILKTALEMATGGVYNQPDDYRNYRGVKTSSWKVTKPYGMSDEKFENRLEDGYARISEQTGISVSDLQGFRLVQGKPSDKGEIQYDLINEQGQKLIKDNAIWRVKMHGVTK